MAVKKANRNTANLGSAKIKTEPFPDLDVKYADNAVVQGSETDVIISFLQLVPPLTNPEDSSYKAEARCVTRLLLKKQDFGELVKKINTFWQKYYDENSQRKDQDNEPENKPQ